MTIIVYLLMIGGAGIAYYNWKNYVIEKDRAEINASRVEAVNKANEYIFSQFQKARDEQDEDVRLIGKLTNEQIIRKPKMVTNIIIPARRQLFDDIEKASRGAK